VAWEYGDALWNYRGGRPALGPLLVHGVKAGETGWRRALLKRVASAELPVWAGDIDLVTSAPTSFARVWKRGFDLAAEAARIISGKLGRPYIKTMKRSLTSKRQARLTESQRRRMPRKTIRMRASVKKTKKTILLVDDVWTTGTTLLRCAETLRASGAKEVRAFSLFRSIQM
jgi:predicted amidophosphoribosyltransferase